MKKKLHYSGIMKTYLFILFGLSFFWASVAFAAFFEYPSLSLSLCLIAYSIFDYPRRVYFLILLYLLEQFVWQGFFGPPLLYIVPVMFITYFLERVSRMPLFMLRIFFLTLCIFADKLILGSFIYALPSLPSTHLAYQLISSACIVTALSFFMSRKGDSQYS